MLQEISYKLSDSTYICDYTNVLTPAAMETKTHLDKEFLSLSIDFDPVELSVC